MCLPTMLSFNMWNLLLIFLHVGNSRGLRSTRYVESGQACLWWAENQKQNLKAMKYSAPVQSSIETLCKVKKMLIFHYVMPIQMRYIHSEQLTVNHDYCTTEPSLPSTDLPGDLPGDLQTFQCSYCESQSKGGSSGQATFEWWQHHAFLSGDQPQPWRGMGNGRDGKLFQSHQFFIPRIIAS